MSHRENISRVTAVNQALRPLGHNFVFVGGAIVSLYADRVSEEVRPTQDVDVVVEVHTTLAFNQMEERLPELGFQNDTTARFVGRYIYQPEGIIVDFMGLTENVLGFNNRWYQEAFQQAEELILDENNTIKIFSAPHYMATKLEAFKGRGRTEDGEYDGRFSTDFEDIVFLMVNRGAIWEEMAQTTGELHIYLRQEFTELLANPYLEEWIDAQTGYFSPAAQAIIIPQIEKFLELS